MHICINGLLLQAPQTGTGQYGLHLLQGLAARDDGHVYTVLSHPSGLRPADLGEKVRFLEAPPRLPSWQLRKLYAEQVTFPVACRRVGAAVAHVLHFGPPLFKSCPTVTTIHDVITLTLPEYRGSLRVRAYAALVSAAARRADIVIADSENSKRDIVRTLGIPPERIHVVYLAAGPRYHPISRASDLAGVRQRYGLPEDFIFYIGGLNRHKNIANLLEAFAALRQRLPRPYTLAIAGRAHSRNRLIFPDWPALARQMGLSVADDASGPRDAVQNPDVRFLSFVPEEDKPLLYNAASLFVFPSRYEGFGLPPLEAMACGAPVVASRAASLPEVVGDGGLLVDPDDPADLAQAMLAALTEESLRASLRQQGLVQAARFSWQKTTEETVQIYERLV